MRLTDRAFVHQCPQRGGDLDLTGLAARIMDTGIERRVAALDRVGGHGAGDERGFQIGLGGE